MKRIGLFVLFIFFFLGCSFQKVCAIESQANSQVGIKFIQGDKETQNSETKDSKDPPTKEDEKPVKGNVLPKTGEKETMYYLLIGGVLLFIILTVLVLKKRRKRYE